MCAINLNTYFVKNTAVIIDAPIPMIKVTPKPLIGPVPKLYKTMPAMSVVMLASRIDVNALLNPESIDTLTLFPT